jgi:hypothetical protein
MLRLQVISKSWIFGRNHYNWKMYAYSRSNSYGKFIGCRLCITN